MSRKHGRERGRTQGSPLSGSTPMTLCFLDFLIWRGFWVMTWLSREHSESRVPPWAPGDFSGVGSATVKG